MVLLWKGKVDESKSVFFNPRIDQNNWRDNDDWFHNIYDSWKDNDSLKDNDWLFKERLKLKDNHSKNWDLLRIGRLILNGKLKIGGFLER